MSNAKLPAFPLPQQQDPCTGGITSYTEFGLSKLEYFAGLAMQGICVNAGRNGHFYSNGKSIAIDAIEMAKDLMVELDKQP